MPEGREGAKGAVARRQKNVCSFCDFSISMDSINQSAVMTTSFFLDPGLHRWMLAREVLSSLEVAGIICIDSSLLACIAKVIMIMMVMINYGDDYNGDGEKSPQVQWRAWLAPPPHQAPDPIANPPK